MRHFGNKATVEDGRFPALNIVLPRWIESVLPPPDHAFETAEDRMRFVVGLSRQNVENETGGPFGAAIFSMKSHRLIAPGVNMVVSSNWSGCHGEMVAFALAQQVVGTHDLGGPGLDDMELVTSTEPCAMCMGATVWSGVRRLVCGARDEDARSIGFDEGPKVDDWAHDFEDRGIHVVRDVLREEACEVLRAYGESGGMVYNGRAE